jgi:hypothetical protein
MIEMEFAQLIGDWLEKAYNGWGWMVYCNDGIANIKNSRMCEAIKKVENKNTPFGFRVFLDKSSVSELKDCVLKAGGELLERCYVTAGPYKGQEITRVDMG